MVYQPFPEVFAAARRSGIALTPHVLHPLPRDGLEPDERCLMLSGLFNLGLICVGSGGSAFLEWWHERLLLDAVIDFPNALFTDQRWVDWVPSLFGGEVLRDHGLNVAYWNLHERPLALGGDGRIMAAGEPLKFFHFSGYESDQPLTLSKYAAGHPRCALVNDPLATGLCSDYLAALANAGYDETRNVPYGLACAPNGLILTPVVRAAYRSGIKTALASGARVPPSPFAAGGDAFCRWLMAPIVGPPHLELGSWHLQLWRQRLDLQAAFPDLNGGDGQRFRDWLDHGPEAQQLQDELGPARRAGGRNGYNMPHSADGSYDGSQRHPSLSVQVMAFPSPATPLAP
jgi:hypothetical protein